MSYDYPTPASGPADGKRPATVTIASVLVLVTALCSLVYLIASVASVGPMGDAFEEIFAGTEVEGTAASVASAFLIAPGAVYFLFGITLAILTIFNNQGRNGTRIATWVVGGIGACCGGGQLLNLALQDATAANFQSEGVEDVPSQEEMTRIINEHIPTWYEPTLLTTTVIGVLALGAALILLALPPSNEFFRRARGQSQEGPPAPPPQYPQFPG